LPFIKWAISRGGFKSAPPLFPQFRKFKEENRYGAQDILLTCFLLWHSLTLGIYFCPEYVRL
jgi:hypothetical protein